MKLYWFYDRGTGETYAKTLSTERDSLEMCIGESEIGAIDAMDSLALGTYIRLLQGILKKKELDDYRDSKEGC